MNLARLLPKPKHAQSVLPKAVAIPSKPVATLENFDAVGAYFEPPAYGQRKGIVFNLFFFVRFTFTQLFFLSSLFFVI